MLCFIYVCAFFLLYINCMNKQLKTFIQESNFKLMNDLIEFQIEIEEKSTPLKSPPVAVTTPETSSYKTFREDFIQETNAEVDTLFL